MLVSLRWLKGKCQQLMLLLIAWSLSKILKHSMSLLHTTLAMVISLSSEWTIALTLQKIWNIPFFAQISQGSTILLLMMSLKHLIMQIPHNKPPPQRWWLWAPNPFLWTNTLFTSTYTHSTRIGWMHPHTFDISRTVGCQPIPRIFRWSTPLSGT